MNIFDKILASGYYVFDGKLNSHLIRVAISYLRKNGMNFSRDELVMKKISEYMYFDFESKHYVLNDGCSLSDLESFIDLDLVTMFHNLKLSWDNHHSKRVKETRTFEGAKRLVKRI